MFDELDFINVKLQSFSSGLSILLESYPNTLSPSSVIWVGHDFNSYREDLADWAHYIEELSDIFLTNYDIFVVSGLIS